MEKSERKPLGTADGKHRRQGSKGGRQPCVFRRPVSANAASMFSGVSSRGTGNDISLSRVSFSTRIALPSGTSFRGFEANPEVCCGLARPISDWYATCVTETYSMQMLAI
jgi:hypothetical protein